MMCFEKAYSLQWKLHLLQWASTYFTDAISIQS